MELEAAPPEEEGSDEEAAPEEGAPEEEGSEAPMEEEGVVTGGPEEPLLSSTSLRSSAG